MTDVHSKEAQRANVFLLWKAGTKTSDIVASLENAHGEHAMSLRSIQRWIESFKAGRTNISDENREGRPTSRRNLITQVEALLQEDARLTVRELADRTDSPSTTVFRVVKDDLALIRLSARWVPRLLTPAMKDTRANTARSNLQRIDEAGGWEQFRQLIVTGDETWVPFFDPPTKQESMVSGNLFSSVHLHCSCSHMHDTPLQVWARKGSNPPLKARRDQHCRKVMLTLFFDCLGPLRIEFLSEGATINAERYVQTLESIT